jgi:hypothetical protein
MKRFFCLAFVLLTAIGAFAQERAIEKAEFDAALRYSYVKFAGQSWRRTENTEDISTETNKNKFTLKSVSEFMPAPAKSRWLIESESLAGKTRRENIRIDGTTFTRTGDGEWTEVKPEPATRRESSLKTVEEQIEYKVLGTEVLGDLSTRVYAKIEKRKLLNEENNSEMFSVITSKYWLDNDGAIVKQETLTENRIATKLNPTGRVYRTLRTTVWELDPNIKIEAPIMNK